MHRFLSAASLALLGAAAPALALNLPPGCDPRVPVTCEYHSPANYTAQYKDFIFRDAARNDHPVPMRVHYPVGARGSLPVIFWHHGLFTTEWQTAAPDWISEGQTHSAERTRSFVNAGYVVIHIGRMRAEPWPRSLAACRAAGWITSPAPAPVPIAELARCASMVGHHVYGRSNLPFVVELLRQGRLAMPVGFIGRFDLDRIVIGGWSGGTEVVMNFAGAPKQFDRLRLDPLPVNGQVVAYFADAPRRPDFSCLESLSSPSGFGDEAFFEIGSRPFLFNTGKGDVGSDACPTQARATAWLASQRGDKILAWSNQESISHGAVDLARSECQGVNLGLCSVYEMLGVAFLDAMVMRRPAAQAWLASDAVRLLTANQIEKHRR
jgi:hypothetical protein